MTINPAQADIIFFDSSWTVFDNNEHQFDDNDFSGQVFPGHGGQHFDAEHLFYKIEGSILSIGLQSGFDLVDGHFAQGSRDYYSGDLALSFDGVLTDDGTNTAGEIAASYEYGIDFGLFTADYDDGSGDEEDPVDTGSGTGIDAAGVYGSGGDGAIHWNTDMVNSWDEESAPFALDGGTLLSGLTANVAGQVGNSYYRYVSFDLNNLGYGNDDIWLTVHWTMSCGNDNMNGTIHHSVPEPMTLSLLCLGLAGLGFMRRRKS